MAVLPTPGSPTSSGLFLRRRHSTWMQRSTSWSRPIRGSTSPFFDLTFRSTQYFASALSSLSPPEGPEDGPSSSSDDEPVIGRASPKAGSLATPWAMKFTAS